jgi:hypothetical protein
MRPPKTISFFEGEKRMSVNVACQRVTGTHLGHPFLHRMAGVHKSPLKSRPPGTLASRGEWHRVEQSATFSGHWRVKRRV